MTKNTLPLDSVPLNARRGATRQARGCAEQKPQAAPQASRALTLPSLLLDFAEHRRPGSAAAHEQPTVMWSSSSVAVSSFTPCRQLASSFSPCWQTPVHFPQAARQASLALTPSSETRSLQRLSFLSCGAKVVDSRQLGRPARSPRRPSGNPRQTPRATSSFGLAMSAQVIVPLEPAS